jgi:hypothetical protein
VGERIADSGGKVYVFTVLEYCDNPKDMFFGTIIPERDSRRSET